MQTKSAGVRRLVICLAVMMAFALSARAQFRYGPSVGLNISDLKFPQTIVQIDRHLAPSAGLQAEMMFQGIGFGLDLGIQYNQLGATAHLNDKKLWQSQGITEKQPLTLHYVQLPLHLRFKWTRMNGVEDIVAPFAYGGPEFSILAGHSSCDPIQFAGGDVSLSAGGGVELYKHWQVSAGYTWGMSYALKAKQLDNWAGRNRHWSVRVSYLF